MLRKGIVMLQFDKARFEYDPYPVCYTDEVFEPSVYQQLVAQYPDKELFEYKPELGNKYSLSEVNNPEKYAAFIRSNPLWAQFHAYIKSDAFIHNTLAYLKTQNIDLGFKKIKIVSGKKSRHASPLSLLTRTTELSARFEFSMMGADGGSIRPHTDAPNKLITLVVSMLGDEEWNPAWGGGTEIVWPKDPCKTYNHINGYLPFDEVDVLRAFPFVPNQCVLFIKTYDSWHAVTPLRGPAGALRKTLTINIESKV